MRRLMFSLSFIAVIYACAPRNDTITIGINPWPGYEYLYLAQELGYYAELGLNVRIVALDSLSDTQRAYIHGRIDGFASTLIEGVQAQVLSKRPLKIILAADYSNGGDMIIASTRLTSVAGLKGKRVGCEVSSLGIYLLHRALSTANMTLQDVEIVNLEQSHGKLAMDNGEIDAFVSYPPTSIEILKNKNLHTIFTTTEIPFEILDIVSLSTVVIEKNPELVSGLRQAWQMALDYEKQNRENAHKIMASRQGILPEEFGAVLGDLTILELEDQKKLFNDKNTLQNRALDVCLTLNQVDAIDFDCTKLPDTVYP